MKVQFVGVGEAFDEMLPNNSQLLEWDGGRLLIDCGYAVPHAIWKLFSDPEYIDAVYLSHRHADHYFGLPSLVVRMAEDGRKRNLPVICADGMKEVILEMIDYAYQAILPKLPFQVVFHEVFDDRVFEFLGAKMEFAPSSHPVKNFSIGIYAEGKKYCYSGDGNFNSRTRSLFTGASLLVHEAYELDEQIHGHAAVSEVLQMAREQGVQRLALTHLNRHVRRERRAKIEEMIRASGMNAFVPEPGEIQEV